MSVLRSEGAGGSVARQPDLARWPDLAPLRASLAGDVRTLVAGVLFRSAVGRVPVRVRYPDGTTIGAGGPGSPTMELHRPPAFLGRVGADGLIGFGESYLAGDWDSDRLAEFLTQLCRKITRLVPEPLQRLRAAYVAKRPRADRPSRANSRSNAARHYDLSNDMFATFLDETMTYSSGLFSDAVVARGDHLVAPAPGTVSWPALADAQRRKVDRLLDRARVGAGSRVLEIGTGWGELAIRAAGRGATVTSVTLSSEQMELARERIATAGHADAVDVQLCDYREVTGAYDAVVSVEMIEAVGHGYWPTYFAKIDEVLAPGGCAAIQAITMPHDRMLVSRNTQTWITKYIFPGGSLPSTQAIEEAVADTSLQVAERLSMGRHYEQTLRLWDERFLGVDDGVTDLGFDSTFARMWHFYLSYSRAGFAADYLDVQQIVLSRPSDP